MKYINFIAIVLVVLLAACTGSGTVYQVPIAEAHRILVASVPPSVFGSQSPDWYVSALGNSEVRWIARKDGREVVRYVASLKEESKGSTRVIVELKAGTGPDAEKKPADNPAIKNLYLVALNERIASALERRAFDMARIRPAAIAAAVNNMGAIRASADEAAAASERMDRSSRR
ncbi:MAG TPA: hypothetical protein VF499_02440 [Afipia sp.]